MTQAPPPAQEGPVSYKPMHATPGDERVHIVEVGPRDGLQTIQATIPTEVKVAFVNALSESGLEEIEVSSFVSPKWVPQLADAAEVFAQIRRVPGVVYSALVPNEKGLERALAAQVDKIAVFTAASETFNQKNIAATIEESIERFRPVVAQSTVPVRGYVSTAFYCPYEGKIAPSQVVPVVLQLLELGVHEISIGDTIGKATTEDVEALLDALLEVVEPSRVAMHFHDTYGKAVANARVAYDMGIRRFDSSAGGIGGCPFAPGAPGNVSTQALLREFAGLHSVEIAAIDRAAAIVQRWTG
ncbi:MAG: hydroxymethylglutaryl-CoA lyase [Fimbriimonadales bacterium]|nr:MAG: hydroxymethylglutaryl-CoA lyase [Fimbriimonadales bacterium]